MTPLWRNKVAKCPMCGKPHPYKEITLPAMNDSGYWRLSCHECGRQFVLPLRNPDESGADYHVSERYVGEYAGADLVAVEIVEHDLNLNRTSHAFDYAAPPIYLCSKTQESLEKPAQSALAAVLKNVLSAYWNYANYVLANRAPDFEHVVIHVPVTCSCGQPHVATFYANFLLTGDVQESLDEYLLAGISGTSLEDRLDGLFSKSDIMNFLEKVVIRWHLTADQIVVAAPFVGHQYMSKKDKLKIWKWLISILDPAKSVFITRKAQLDAYKAAMDEVDGLKHAFLQDFDLESKLVSADTRRQDFHAKFFIGLTNDRCEVLSGSANLTRGPSVENISFRILLAEACHDRYIRRIGVALPPRGNVISDFVLIKESEQLWSAWSTSGPRLA